MTLVPASPPPAKLSITGPGLRSSRQSIFETRIPGSCRERLGPLFRYVTAHAVNDVTLPRNGETLTPCPLKGMSPTAHAANDVGISFGPLVKVMPRPPPGDTRGQTVRGFERTSRSINGVSSQPGQSRHAPPLERAPGESVRCLAMLSKEQLWPNEETPQCKHIPLPARKGTWGVCEGIA